MPSTVHDDADAEVGQTVGLVPLGIDVALSDGTTGAGTLADPYVGGWATLTYSANETYVFRPGKYYKTTTVVDWAHSGLNIIGNGARILCVGAGYIAIETAAPGYVTDLSIDNLIIFGDGSTASPLKLSGVTNSWFSRIATGDCATIGISLKFVLTSTFFKCSVSINTGYFSTMPVDGIVLDQRNAVEGCIGNVFLACSAEGVSGTGFKFIHASSNAVIGGTSEANARGIDIRTASDNVNNLFESMHMESNSAYDIYCTTGVIRFSNIQSGGTVLLGDGGVLSDTCSIMGGVYAGAVTINGLNTMIYPDAVFSGTFTDNAATTRYIGDLTPLLTTLQTTGNVGLGGAPSAVAGALLALAYAGDGAAQLSISNSNVAGTAARSQLSMVASVAALSLNTHGTARVAQRWGHALGDRSELVATAGTSFDIGTLHAAPLHIGTNSQTREFFSATPKALTESAATGIAEITVANNTVVGGTLYYTVEANDGTEYQARVGAVQFGAASKAGTITTFAGTPTENIAASSGTLTATFTVTTGAAKIILNLNAVSSLTQTTLTASYRIVLDGGTANPSAL